MYKKALLFLLILLGAGQLSAAEYSSKIDLLKGEHWWGVFVVSGRAMPFDKPFAKVDLATWAGGQTTPFLVSSRGRYIWSAEPFAIEYNGLSFLITSPKEEVKAVTGGRSLREAYLVCCHKNFPPSGKTPAIELFTRPVYDTRRELGFEPTADGLRTYADRLLQAGFPAGTLVLGAGWQQSVGSFDPDPLLLGDFKALLGELHDKGFKIMLTVTPYVSGDGRTYRQYRGSDIFVRNAGGDLTTCAWDGGYSALYDLTREETSKLLRGWLEGLHRDCGVDGYVFDCRGAVPAMSRAAGGSQAYLEAWTKMGEGFPFCEYTISRSRGFDPYVHLLNSTLPLDGNVLKGACADMLNANLLGYPYTIIHPKVDSLTRDAAQAQTMLLRTVMLSAFLPVMHIPFTPSQVHDPALEEALKGMCNLRVQMADYYETLVKESARTAEPILRHMEYEFPRNGFTDCNDQFMLGSKYLVAPLLDASNSRTVRFPRGIWVDRDGKRYKGPLVTTVNSPLGYPLVFQSAK